MQLVLIISVILPINNRCGVRGALILLFSSATTYLQGSPLYSLSTMRTQTECPYCVALGALEAQSFSEEWAKFDSELPPGTCGHTLDHYKRGLASEVFLTRCPNFSDSNSNAPGTLYPIR
jgi:hypothetical protein